MMQFEKPSKKTQKGWDQFRVNEELFGYKSTYKEDLSQYTTPLNVKELPEQLKQKANKIAKDIEDKHNWKGAHELDTGAEYEQEDEGDEENLFSAVPALAATRTPGEKRVVMEAWEVHARISACWRR